MSDKQREYGTPAPAVGISEASMQAAHMIPPGGEKHGPENGLVWAGEHLGYPKAMTGQHAPESPYANPGKGV